MFLQIYVNFGAYMQIYFYKRFEMVFRLRPYGTARRAEKPLAPDWADATTKRPKYVGTGAERCGCLHPRHTPRVLGVRGQYLPAVYA